LLNDLEDGGVSDATGEAAAQRQTDTHQGRSQRTGMLPDLLQPLVSRVSKEPPHSFSIGADTQIP
jgi:hypothetical protein